jgi:hypothetical protein
MLFACILAVWAVPAHAQAIGSIFGKVTDPSGAVLPGVTVTVTGTGLQQPLVAVTSESGTYQFPSVPLGTYSVTFELTNFKKALRQNVVISSGFNAGIDVKLELGQMSEEVTISAAAPVVDTKKTATGATFTSDVLEKIPTSRDPWQIINMAPGVQAGLNVGGSASGQQVSLAARGTSANVQWNLEGGSITDLSSNSSPSYYNFDAFDQIQVTTGGGDVSVQSSGLSINLVTKSGSNVFKGSATGTFENGSMQAQNVSHAQFNAGSNGFLSGNPVKKIDVLSAEYGGPILKNKLWFWAGVDRQDINVGIVNFFDPSLGSFCQQLISAQKQGSLASLVTYGKIGDVNHCLANDKTVIKDIQYKINYQLNSKNKFQYLYGSDNKYRNHRGASPTTAPESTFQQTSDKVLGLPLPTHSFVHTLILSDKLVFNNQYTYVHGGFFLDYQDVPPQGNCPQSRYNGSDQSSAYARSGCLWETQSLFNSTTNVTSRSLFSTYQTKRPSHELKTDGTYFLTHVLGGDHSLKFGLGWRKNPILSFSHYSGGGQASIQCIGNTQAGCGDGSLVPAGSASGQTAYEADLYRDQLRNNDWWSYFGYLQDSYSRGRIRLNGGVRYDWQQSKYLGGCIPANVIRPDLLPAQCEQATQVDPVSGRKIQSFGNWAPRVSATYDLFGNGKTQIHGNYAYFYDTKITLADALGGLFTTTELSWGPNNPDGTCDTSAGASCWVDSNLDGKIQPNELIGTPSSSSSRFQNGVLVPAGNIVDPSAKLARTREGVIGAQHELIPNLALGVDFIYRKYDRGTAQYTIGYQPGGPNGSLSALYVPASYTDPITGLTAIYYQICQGCTRPSGLGNIVVTNPNYRTYKGVDLTATKRYSNRWQAAVAVTIQDNPSYYPAYSPTFINPTGIDYRQGLSTISKYVTKTQGSYTFKWDIAASVNFNWNQGAVRNLSPSSGPPGVLINGPGQVYGGTTGKIKYSTLTVQNINSYRYGDLRLLDAGVQKTFRFRGGKNRVKLMFDGFNLTNDNTNLSYAGNNLSKSASYNSPASIVPPRIFRVGATFNF